MAGDPFLSDPSKKRKRQAKTTSTTKKQRPAPKNTAPQGHDSEISSDSDVDPADMSSNDEAPAATEERELDSDEEFASETAADKRRRLAKQYLENLKEQELAGDEFDGQELDDDLLARRLQDDAAEGKGHAYKHIAEKIEKQLDQITRSTARVGSKNLTAVAVKHPFAYTVSKDMELIKWNVGGKKPQRVKHTKGGLKFFNNKIHHCDQINCVAVSPDGRYVVTGGNDARLIIWSTENLTCLRVIDTRAAVNAITFRRNSDQLFAACADLRIRTFSIAQQAQLEILYGHQDNITDISALSRETCVSVGSRDKTAMFWKIAEESRLTFRGGDSTDKKRRRKDDDGPQDDNEPFHMEGSMEVCSMVDESHFVTGADNGNIAFWSLGKKKALFTQRLGHGLMPQYKPSQASAETSEDVAQFQIPDRQPYWITAIHSVPYTDFFITGSYDGELRLWKIDKERFKRFSPMGVVGNVKGVVVGIDSCEPQKDTQLTILVATSKEHKFGRWLGKVEGARNNLTALTFDI
ncbi:hypothetical protein CXQ85_004583 [Candidozyma haemuli]|uniref:Uncharacterized protein n=1 Tax=Candidozyma haemuli TaxID=45357 RepID=A0A2V1AVV1_9ASCO|nr:hypothetical protein CXQ85_004583 [[Candida] haemuloni]PVH21919.1 hypothetical protein CXQ85_004583 [[Candida] haemuloni]